MTDIDRNNLIATKLRELADLFHGVSQGAGPETGTKTLGQHLADAGVPVNPHTISAEDIDKCRSPEAAAKAKATRAAKAKPAEENPAEKVVIAKPDVTPEQIAADLKAKLVALVGKNRAKAVAILGAVGAKNFSTIPVDKHPSVLLDITAALTACEENDPLA